MSSYNNLQTIICNVEDVITSDNLQEVIANEVNLGDYYLGDVRYFTREEEMRRVFPKLTDNYEVSATLDFEVIESYNDDYDKVTYAKLTLRVYTDEQGNDAALLVAEELETTLVDRD